MKFDLHKPLELLDEKIESIRVRQPDVNRKELGCSDLVYQENEYNELRQIALDKNYDITLRKEYKMIELSILDINCYAYFVKNY